ncbi:hypothetical protein EJ02DRAFT_451477 [Clathrospora elynae]|uniref:Uncharacterized protein n=1 Tax=Clathrospora elynae TaxID=706981 RepID=A0A6A5T3W0_9PLEO|nr:hypothetical protein EJ02DRAFT_451477 [Clathrospora elynae]
MVLWDETCVAREAMFPMIAGGISMSLVRACATTHYTVEDVSLVIFGGLLLPCSASHRK